VLLLLRLFAAGRCLLDENEVYTMDCGRFIHGKGSAAGNTIA
jgi:hypothetical protein